MSAASTAQLPSAASETVEARLLAGLGVLLLLLAGLAAALQAGAWARYLGILVGPSVILEFQAAQGVAFALGALLVALRLPASSIRTAVLAVVFGLLAVVAVFFHDLFALVRATAQGAELPAGLVAGALLILPLALLHGAVFALLLALPFLHFLVPRSMFAMHGYYILGAALGAAAGGMWLVPQMGLPGIVLAGAAASVLAGLCAWTAYHRAGTAPFGQMARVGSAAPVWRARAAAFAAGCAGLAAAVPLVRVLILSGFPAVLAAPVATALFALGLAAGAWLAGRLLRVALPRKMRVLPLTVALLFAAVAALAVARAPDYYLYGRQPGAFGLPAGIAAPAAALAAVALFAGLLLPHLARFAERCRGAGHAGMVAACFVLGAAAGAVAAHALLPVLGALGVLAVVAALLGAAAAALALWRAGRGGIARAVALAGAAVAAAALLGAISGRPVEIESVLFSRDGGAHSVMVTESVDGFIRRLRIDHDLVAQTAMRGTPTEEEIADALLGALSLLHFPAAERALVAGVRTGAAARALLSGAALTEVVAVDPEPAVALGMRLLDAGLSADVRLRAVRADLHVHVLSLPQNSVDILVAAPAQAWSGGESGLFTVEGFSQARRVLADGGVLALRLPFDGASEKMFASVLLALTEVFPEFSAYLSGTQMIVLAGKDGGLRPDFAAELARLPELAEFVSAYGMRNAADMAALQIPGSGVLMANFRSMGVPTNSDSFPVLEEYARHVRRSGGWYKLLDMIYEAGFVFQTGPLSGWQVRAPFAWVSSDAQEPRLRLVAAAQGALRAAQGAEFAAALDRAAQLVRGSVLGSEMLMNANCPDEHDGRLEWVSRLMFVFEALHIHLLGAESERLWKRFESELPCFALMSSQPDFAPLLAYLSALAKGDFAAVRARALEIFPTGLARSGGEIRMILYLMLAEIDGGRFREAAELPLRLPDSLSDSMVEAVRIIVANAYYDELQRDGQEN